MYNMTVYSGKDRHHISPLMTSNDATFTSFNSRIENMGHKLYMDNQSSALSDDLIQQQ